MICRICGCNIRKSEYINKLDIDVNSVYTMPTKKPKCDMEFYYCSECGHGQIKNVLSQEHYKEYSLLNVDNKKLSGGANIELRMEQYKDVLKKLKELAIDTHKLLDIGCGTGEVLLFAKKNFTECYGIEPSEVECSIAEERGCKVINACFDDSFQGEEYSAFISTQVFEHLEDPVGVLKIAERILKVGGVGYIEVPNGQRIYDNSNYYNVFCEHLNYFSPSSLARMAHLAGFEIISINEVQNGNHLELFMRKKGNRLGFEKAKKISQIKIQDAVKKYQTISLWGSGVKGKIFLHLLDEVEQKKFKYLFDNNNRVHMCYIGDCVMPIEKPNIDKINENDLIIITAVEYITDELKNIYNYKGNIECIDAYLEEG